MEAWAAGQGGSVSLPLSAPLRPACGPEQVLVRVSREPWVQEWSVLCGGDGSCHLAQRPYLSPWPGGAVQRDTVPAWEGDLGAAGTSTWATC